MFVARSSTWLVAAMLAVLTVKVDAFWRMECRARSGTARIDPLVSPGETAQHVHVIHGGSGFGETTDYSDLMASDCTSCSVTEDKSAYWTPALYFQSASGGFQLVGQVGGMLAYYFLYPLAGQTSVTAFPENFRMIAGDSLQRNFTLPVPDPDKSSWASLPGQETQEGLAAKAIGFNCLNYAIAPEGSLYRHFMPDKGYLDAHCADGIRMELMFPSCWDGQNTDSANHKDHMAYPDLVMNGNCPSTHPVRTVGLFYETIWDTAAFVGQDGQFVISNGDPTGYGYHGDFIMGWDGSLLQNAVNTCTNPSGMIQDCPLFDIQSSNAYSNCNFTMPADLESENVVNPPSALPGNVAIQSGPAYATISALAGSGPSPMSTGQPVPTLTHSAGSVVPTDASTFVPGDVFIKTSGSAVPAAAAAATSPAAAAVAAAPSAPAYVAPVPAATTPSPAAAAAAAAATPMNVNMNMPVAASSPAAAPTTTLQAVVSPANDALQGNQVVVATSTYTIGRDVYNNVIIEELDTVTATATATAVASAPMLGKRAGHHLAHLQRHGRHHG